MWYVWRTGEVHTEGKTPLGRPRDMWEDYIKMYLQEVEGVRTGATWLRIGTGGELLRMRY